MFTFWNCAETSSQGIANQVEYRLLCSGPQKTKSADTRAQVKARPLCPGTQLCVKRKLLCPLAQLVLKSAVIIPEI